MKWRIFNAIVKVAIWIGFVIAIISYKQLIAIIFLLIIILTELEDIHATIKSISVPRQAHKPD